MNEAKLTKKGLPDKRMNRRNQEEVRLRIRASALISRLQRHIDGELQLTATQVKAAEILLRKCLPDLTRSTVDMGENAKGAMFIIRG